MLYEKIIKVLKKEEVPLTQAEIAERIPHLNRAVLLGYLRAMVDLGKIRSKDSGKAKVYFMGASSKS